MHNQQSQRRGQNAPKRQGELAEAAFLDRAIRLGLAVAQPWGDSERYDFIVDAGSRFWRVQVKSSSCQTGGQYGYAFKTYSQGRQSQRDHYTSSQIDIFAAYVIPENLWYILPIKVLERRLNFSLYPDNRRPRQRANSSLPPIPTLYREAWWILAAEQKPV